MLLFKTLNFWQNLVPAWITVQSQEDTRTLLVRAIEALAIAVSVCVRVCMLVCVYVYDA